MTLLRRYGHDDAVFFYNEGTYDREVGALIKLSKTLDCSRLMIITYTEERTIEIGEKTIEVLPVWK